MLSRRAIDSWLIGVPMVGAGGLVLPIYLWETSEKEGPGQGRGTYGARCEHTGGWASGADRGDGGGGEEEASEEHGGGRERERNDVV
jgi:hypothetical protein